MTIAQLKSIGIKPPTEEQEQQIVAQWLDLAGVLWTAVPNGGKRSALTGARLKMTGTKRGVPDILCFTPPPPKLCVKDFVGVALEMKRTKGGTLSAEQHCWLQRLSGLGWAVKVCYGANEAIDWLVSLGYRTDKR